MEPGGEAELDLEVVPSARAAGVVKTSDGEPVVGAVVEPSASGNNNSMFAMMLGIGASFGAAVTDHEGRYEIDILAPGGEYKITASAPDHPTAESDKFTAAGGKTETVDLEMKGGPLARADCARRRGWSADRRRACLPHLRLGRHVHDA